MQGDSHAEINLNRLAELERVVAAMPGERREDFLAALPAFADAADEPEPRPDEVSSLGWYVEGGAGAARPEALREAVR